MTIQPGANVYTQGFGSRPENVEVPHLDTRAPTTTDVKYPIGKRWVNTAGGTEYTLTSMSTSAGVVTANWTLLGTNGGALNTLSDDATTTVAPVSNNIQLAGTAGQIATTAGVGEITFSLIGPYTPSSYTAHTVLLGEGGSSIGVTNAGTNGQLLVGSTGADPAFATMTSSGSTITVTGGAHTINIDVSAPLNVAHGGTGDTTLTTHGVLVGSGTSAITALTAGSNGQVLLGSTAANPAFSTLTTSTGVLFTTGAHTLAIDVQQGGFAIDAASTGVALVAQNSYTVTQAAQTSFSLPATASVGDRFVVASATGNTSGWIITQGASQEIWNGTSHTTNGVTGTLAGAIHTAVELMCVVANNEFIIMGGTGLTGLTFT